MNDIIAWLVALAAVSLFAYAYFLKLRTIRESRLARAADEFYNDIGPLLDDDDAPESAIDVIDLLSRAITNRSVADSGLSIGIDDAVAYYLNKRRDLAEHFFGALVAASFAITYQSAIFGFLLRRLVFFDLNRHRDRAPDIVASLHRPSGTPSAHGRGRCMDLTSP
jgi:hypothetical protein